MKTVQNGREIIANMYTFKAYNYIYRTPIMLFIFPSQILLNFFVRFTCY